MITKEFLKKTFVYSIVRHVRLGINCVKYHVSKEKFTQQLFEKQLGYPLDLKNPKTFNEKIQWLKLNRMTKDYIQCADKYMLREWIADRLPEYKEHFPRVLAVYEKASDVDLSNLPQRFVIKCNHGCGFNFVCTDKNNVDVRALRKKIWRWLHTNYEYVACEPQYHFMKKTVFVEEFLDDGNGHCPPDYKFFCSKGRIQAIMVCLEREHHGANYHYLDENWNPLALDKDVDLTVTAALNKPICFAEMNEMARKISSDFDFVRVDFYDTANKAMIGEMTFTPAGGMDDDFGYETDLEMGSWIDLTK